MAEPRGTLADVAARAGVSVPTVSKVVNGRSDVAPATRAKVIEAVQATGYLSLLRRATTRSSAGALELLIEGVDSPWALEIVRGVEGEAARRGAALVVTSTVNDTFTTAGWVEALRARRSNAVVAVVPTQGSLLPAVRRAGVPIVLVDSEATGTGAMPLVRATGWAGAYAATEHLISLGHRRIGHLAGPDGLRSALERREGYSAALRAAGLQVDDRLVVAGEYRTSAAMEVSGRLLDENPTAVFCASDSQAFGLYSIAHDRGLRIPDDLSVVGFDDTMLSRHLSPALTTVHQPLAAMGAEAVRIALALADDPEAPLASRIELATHLVIRRSAAAPAD